MTKFDIADVVLRRLARRAWRWCFANGFFVAAEFSIVDGAQDAHRSARSPEGHRGARAVRRAVTNPDSYIAATQLGITMASLGLGWIGEPAVASLIQPLSGVPARHARRRHGPHAWPSRSRSPIVTALHIVLGELAPKTIALERAEATALLVVKPTELFMRAFCAVHPPAERRGPGRRRACSGCASRAATPWCTPRKS